MNVSNTYKIEDLVSAMLGLERARAHANDCINYGLTRDNQFVIDLIEILHEQIPVPVTKRSDALSEAVALLRDWEDYEPDDPECTWVDRRDAFLAEYEHEVKP